MRWTSKQYRLMESNEWTSIFYAALNGHNEIVTFLIDKGANVHVQNK